MNKLFSLRHCTLYSLLCSSFILSGCYKQQIVESKPALSAIEKSTVGLSVQQSAGYQEALRLYGRHDYSAALASINSLLQQPQYQKSLNERNFLLHQQALCRHAINPNLAVSEALPTSVPPPHPMPLLASQADCGPRALFLLCPEFGIHTNLKSLRQLAGTNSKGTSMQGLSQAAKAIGLKPKGVQMDRQAIEQVSAPAIVWYDGNHYVALLSVAGEQATIHDPNKPSEEVIPINELLGRSGGFLLTLSK